MIPEKLQKGHLQAMSGALRGVDSDGVDQKHFLFKTTVEYILDKFKHQEMTSVKSHGGISVSSF